MINDIEKVLLTREEIEKKVRELGQRISEDYKNKDIVLVNVLRGGVVFLTDLIRTVTIPVTVDFMAISSYGPSTETSGVVKIIKDLEEEITNREVLVVEDIIDTGLTLGYLLRNLRSREPASLEVCTLINKPFRRIIDIPLKYVGFEIPDQFVVGYGLDYGQKYRNLPFVGVLKPEIYAPLAK